MLPLRGTFSRARLLIACASLAAAAVVSLPAAAAPEEDPYLDRQWGLAKIEAPRAWEVATGRGALIAIVDTGVDLKHPDLADKIVYYKDADMVDPRGACSRTRGRKRCIDDGAADYNGHGSHVAGIAAAITGNGTGGSGTAPDARILPVRVLDAEGSGTSRQVAKGIVYAADKGADVINLSLGVFSGAAGAFKISGRLDAVYEAIDYAWGLGAVVVAAAGNDTFPLCSEPSSHPRTLCVGAIDRHDTRSWYSNSDATLSSYYFVAPGGRGMECGGDILSTFTRWGTQQCSEKKGYEALSGTSMAAPFISGVVALLIEQGLSQEQIRRCLVRSADDLGLPGRDSIYGYGRINAYRAVSGCT